MGDGGTRMRLATKAHHILPVSRRQAGIADHLPRRLVAIPAVDGIGERAALEQRIDEPVEPLREVQWPFGDFAAGQILQELFALGRLEFIENSG